jgi:hypothetical protein
MKINNLNIGSVNIQINIINENIQHSSQTETTARENVKPLELLQSTPHVQDAAHNMFANNYIKGTNNQDIESINFEETHSIMKKITKLQTWVFYTGEGYSQKDIVIEMNCKIPSRTKVWKVLLKKLNEGTVEKIGYKVKE